MRASVGILFVLAAADAFSLTPLPQRHLATSSAPQRSRAVLAEAADEQQSIEQLRWKAFQRAWAKYVLLRPDWSFDELKKSTRAINFRNGRTPGTNRTMFFTSFLLILAAIPSIFTNEKLLYWFLELAALDRAGITPAEMLEKTGSLW